MSISFQSDVCSGDQFILKLLAVNLAKLGTNKKEISEIEVCAKKTNTSFEIVKKVEQEVAEADFEVNNDTRKFGRCPDTSTRNLSVALVYNHLSKVSPNLAAELAASHQFQRSLVKLEEVLAAWQNKPDMGVMNLMKADKMDQKKTTRVGCKFVRFTPQEDKVILATLKEAGEAIDYAALARKLNRTNSSVHNRVGIFMRKGGVKEKRKSFSLVQDQIILETLIIERLRSEKLSKIIFRRACCKELANLWNIDYSGLINRWTTVLQPTLLQHFSGTLNLRVERMVANYVLKNYTEFSQINWTEVAVQGEFVGYTETSLRKMYFTNLSRNARNKLGVEKSKMTPQHVAQYCEAVYGEGGQGGRMGSKRLQRQADVIAFFESKMAELGISDFL